MTQVGHALTAAAIGVACMPKEVTPRQKTLHMLAFILLGSLPDWPFPYWGHDRYYISHSIFVNLLLIGLGFLILLFLPDARKKLGGWPILAGATLAWLSHLLLDTFYNHGIGLLMFWPFLKARLALPIPWLAVSKSPFLPITFEKVRIGLIELVTFSPLLLLVLWIRRRQKS